MGSDLVGEFKRLWTSMGWMFSLRQPNERPFVSGLCVSNKAQLYVPSGTDETAAHESVHAIQTIISTCRWRWLNAKTIFKDGVRCEAIGWEATPEGLQKVACGSARSEWARGDRKAVEIEACSYEQHALMLLLVLDWVYTSAQPIRWTSRFKSLTTADEAFMRAAGQANSPKCTLPQAIKDAFIEKYMVSLIENADICKSEGESLDVLLSPKEVHMYQAFANKGKKI